MTPLSELDRLFPTIAKPDPLEPIDIIREWLTAPADSSEAEVDADETNHGPCAQGDCDE